VVCITFLLLLTSISRPTLTQNFFFFCICLGCTFCGGLGHRIDNCPKLEQQRKQQMNSMVGSRGESGRGGDY
jgi:hypothetical protein